MAARDEGIKSVGIEINKKYCEVAVERLEGKGLDSCVDGYDWKMSPSLRKRIKNINTLDMSHY